MKNALKPVRKSTWRSSLDLEYLDETSDVKQEQMERYQREIGKKLNQFNDYASKEEIGEVHVAGFLHDAVAQNPDGTWSFPGSLSKHERKRRIAAAWKEKLHLPVYGRGAKNDVLQHRLVFSMSGELYARCIKSGINPDKVLHHSMRTVMRKFQEKFHPGDRISYAYGFHHDTDHPHVHVALCPRTAANQYVGYSKPKYRHNPSQQRDHYTFMQKAFETECQKWGQTLSSPKKIRNLQSLDDAEGFFFHQKVTKARALRIQRDQPAEVRRISQTGLLLSKLKQEIEEIESARKIERMSRLVSQCFGWKPITPALPFIRSATKIGKSARALRLKKLRADYFRLRAIYRHELTQKKTDSYEQSPANRQANYRRCQESYQRDLTQRTGISL